MTNIVIPTTYTPIFISGSVSSAQFGANFLFDRDYKENSSGGPVSTAYAMAISDMGIENLRYPGGTISEAIFDLKNPNNAIQSGTQVMPMGDFVGYCATSGKTMTLVMPTARFMSTGIDGTGNRLEAVDVSLVQSFIASLLATTTAQGVSIKSIELGNEWWAQGLTATEYGRVASKLAEVIQDSIDSFKVSQHLSETWEEPDIVSQVGQGGHSENESTQQIIAEFSDHELFAVDGVLTHRYLSGPWIDGWAYAPFDTWDALAASRGDTRDFARIVTEWNVKASNRLETGLRSASSLVALFAEMMEAGVDSANIWAVQQNNNQNLTTSTGLPGDDRVGLSISGEAFKLMSESIQGLNLIDINGSSVGQADADSTTWVQVYVGEGKVVIFVSDRSGQADHISVDLGGLTAGLNYVWLTKLGVVNGLDPLDPDMVPTRNSYWAEHLTSSREMSIDLAPWETVRLVFTVNGAGYTLKGDERADFLLGSPFDDKIVGLSGEDTITSSDGDDYLFGGSDRDFLLGGGGKDRVKGGLGDDMISGGGGGDLLFGGPGNDRIFGSKGSDVILGGRGADSIFCGVDSNDDIIVFSAAIQSEFGALEDSIYQFDSTKDHIYLRDIDADTTVVGNQEFTWAGKVATAHSVWSVGYNNGVYLLADVSGDAVADLRAYFSDVANIYQYNLYL